MKHLFLGIICCLASLSLYAQVVEEPPVIVDDPEEEIVEDIEAPEVYAARPATYSPPKVALRPAPNDAWKKAGGSLNYSDDVPKVVEEEPQPQERNLPNFNWDTAFWSGFGKIFSIIVLIILVGLVIYQMVQSPSNQAIRAADGTPITFDNLDAYIQETDLERFLREALAAGNYNQAVRIYYLQIIKNLSQKELIQWSREKTNRDYLREMRSHPLSAEFRAATSTYEEVWYGNLELDRQLYEGIETRMKKLM